MSREPEPGSEWVLVRAYMRESQAKVPKLLERLFATPDVGGVTLIRGMAGFGTRTVLNPGELASEDDPPVILEFFGTRAVAARLADTIRRLVAVRHILVIDVERCG